jgi:transposase-like protein
MSNKKRTQQYPADFKTQAVQLAITSDKSRRVVADELGTGMSTLAKWVKQYHRTPNETQPRPFHP